MVNEKESEFYKVVKEGQENVLRINMAGFSFPASVEDNENCMDLVVGKLAEITNVSRVLLVSSRNYEYSYDDTQMLLEVANIYNYLSKQKRIFTILSKPECSRFYSGWQNDLRYIIFNLLKKDPLGAYVELKRITREERVRINSETIEEYARCRKGYVNVLSHLIALFDRTKLISTAKPYLDGYRIGDRSVYRRLFRANVSPNFMFTRLMMQHPIDAEEVDAYGLDNKSDVVVYRKDGEVRHLYHITPSEFKLTEDKYELIELARAVMSEHEPRAEEFIDPERMRRTFFNIGRDLLRELSEQKSIDLSYEELNEMADILVRYTVGFGLIEVLLQDKNVQDITVNGPIGQTPIFIVHGNYDECMTNIMPSREDALGWATRFRLLSGRPLDEANPVLDTELSIPGARARVAVMTEPLSPWGLAYAFRRHRDLPWTLPLFIENKMLNPLAAGLMSFLIDGARTMLIAGTRSSGKTSLLGASLLEIMKKYRLITVEDSVTGDSPIFIRKFGKIKRTTVGKLIDSLIEEYGCWYNLSGHEILGNDESIEVLSMNKKGKIKFTSVGKFIRHKVKKPIYKVLTRTGKEIKVTGDHSLFNIDENGNIKEVKVNSLKENDFIATSRRLSFNNKEKRYLNLLNYLDKFDKGYFVGEEVKELYKKYYFEIKQLAKEHGHNRSLRTRLARNGVIPVKIIKDLVALGYDVSILKTAKFKFKGNSNKIPVLIELNKDFLTFIGLWIADGCYDRKSVILSVVEDENRKVAYRLSKKFGFNIKMHSDAFSLMLNSVTLRKVMRDVLDLKGNAYTKRIPEWVFNLSDEQISYVLRGIFSGDGCVAKYEIVIPLASFGLLKDIQTLLLNFGIILRIGVMRKDKTYNAGISAIKYWKIFRDKIGILPKSKSDRLDNLCLKISTHDVSDVIPLNFSTKRLIRKIYNNFQYSNYIHQNSNIGREKLLTMLKEIESEDKLIDNLRILSTSDIYWDRIKKIELIEDFNDYVYDLSVPENESFVCDGIIAHNTLELNVDAMRKLGYNIQPMKVQAVITKGGSEVPADEGIRTSLRLGDSALIVGEVRSLEARSLYEAMRVGALANVVAGTIHGDSPYGVFDRVVNDLKVPRTSFKATDVIFIVNPVRSADGLHKWRRVTQITEVRKEWEEDPLRENGFVDLMRYNAKKDVLEPTEDLINGDSDVLKSIAGNVKEWVGNWDGLWNNILLRAKIKENLVNYAVKNNMKELLEAEFVIRSNDIFHRISDSVREEVGELDSKRIFFEWEDWLKKEIRQLQI